MFMCHSSVALYTTTLVICQQYAFTCLTYTQSLSCTSGKLLSQTDLTSFTLRFRRI